MRIEIPKPNDSGSCPSRCPLFIHMQQIGCSELAWRPPLLGYVPGPSCRPGLYDLVPVAEVEGMRKTISDWQSCGDRIMEAVTGKAAPLSDSDVIGEVAALRAEIERLKQEHREYEHYVMTGRNDQHDRLEAENERLRKVLQKILDNWAAVGWGYNLQIRNEARAALEGKA